MATGSAPSLPEGYPVVDFRPGYESLFSDPRFANQIAQRTILVGRIRGCHQGVREAIDELLALLEPFPAAGGR